MASGSLQISRYTTSDPTVNFLGWWDSVPNQAQNTSALTLNVVATKQTGDPIVARNVTTNITVSANGAAGTMKTETVQLTLTPGSVQQQTLFSQTFNVNHDSSGDCSISASISISGYVQGTGAQTFTLDHIDVPPLVITSLRSVTETSVAVNWSADAEIDYLWYSTNNGSTWTANGSISGTSGGITITGLSSHTTYSIKIKVRKKSTQVTAESDELVATTYYYPYATTMPNFTIGNSVTIGIYNPLGRTVTVKLRSSSSDTNISTISTSGKSVSGFNGATAITGLYAAIPNAKSGTYRIAVTYGSHTETRTGGTYSVNVSACTPELDTPTYQDTNSTATSVTQDNQIIVQNKSIPSVSVTGLASKNSASIASVTASCAGQTITLTRNGTTATGTFGIISAASDAVCTVTITDSRGITASKTVTMTVQPYVYPTLTVQARRHNNYYTETEITPRATIAPITGNVATIGYAGSSSGGGVVSGTLTNNTTTQVNLDNNYDWSFSVAVTDSFGSGATILLKIPKGTPLIFFDKDRYSVGINCFPEHDKTFEVDGAVLNRNVMTAQATGVQGASGTNKISLTSQNSVGDQFTLSSGSVKVGAKVKKVLVSLRVTTLGSSAASHTIYVYKGNSTAVSVTMTLPASVNVETMVIPPTLIDVTENDTLSVYVAGFASSNYLSAYLTVEAMA